MPYKSVVISSGHGKYVRGASGILDEVDEARRVVDRVTDELEGRDVKVEKFHDNTSRSQNENLNTIVKFHNSKTRELDISVHFNAYEQVTKPMGTEVLYITQSSLAGQLSSAISSVGFINRGPKKRTDLFFLNNTEMPAVLLEICFVDSEADADIYTVHFDTICEKIADLLAGQGEQPEPPSPEVALFHTQGKVSYFGGPDDTGVSPTEGLAFISSIGDQPQLFLPYQPEGTTGLARRLNPYVHYVACRWDYNKTSKTMLKGDQVALVRSLKDPDRALTAFPADWGPNQATGRVADISLSLLLDLGLVTDDEVEVIYPYKAE